MNKTKDLFPITKSSLPGSCYVYNSTSYTAITTELYPNKTNSHELYSMEPLASKRKVAPKVPIWKVKYACIGTNTRASLKIACEYCYEYY